MSPAAPAALPPGLGVPLGMSGASLVLCVHAEALCQQTRAGVTLTLPTGQKGPIRTQVQLPWEQHWMPGCVACALSQHHGEARLYHGDTVLRVKAMRVTGKQQGRVPPTLWLLPRGSVSFEWEIKTHPSSTRHTAAAFPSARSRASITAHPRLPAVPSDTNASRRLHRRRFEMQL